MKKIRNKNSKILLALSLMFATSALGLISFGTMCAFQNKEQESFQYQTDIKPLTSYFDGGIGTLSNPYIISDEQSFIDFQKLVQLGCFTYNTYFQLGADISFSADTVLDPIGTENCPFNSQFDGMGHKLSNLKVSSLNHEDVGVFGYVGSGAYIKNIILDTPSITSTGPSTKTVNPLEGIMPSSSITTPTYTTTSVTMSSRVVQGTDSNNYTVYFRSANKGILTDDGVLQTANIKSNNKFAIHVDAIITTSYLINNEPMVVTYVADRFAVYIENKAILSTDGVVSLFDRSADGDGTYTTKDPHYYEDKVGSTVRMLDQVTYVGLVAGHMDGEAEYIGVYNGSITANKKQTISHSSLIGKHKDDTLLNSLDNNFYYQEVDFSNMIETHYNKTYTEDKPAPEGNFKSYGEGYYETHNYKETDTKHDIDNSDIFDNTNTYLEDIGIEIPDAFRIYNDFGVSHINSININGALDEETQEVDYTTTDQLEGIYFDKNMTNRIVSKEFTYKAGWNQTTTAHTVLNYDVNNALWIFTNKNFLKSGDSIWSSILDSLFADSNITVYVTVKLTYSVPKCTACNAREGKETKLSLKYARFSDFDPPGNYGYVMGKDYIKQFGDSDYSDMYKPTENGVENWYFNDYNNNIEQAKYTDENGNVLINDDYRLICPKGNDYSNIIMTKTITVQSTSKVVKPLLGDTITYSPLFILGLENIEGTNSRIDIYKVELLISFDQGNFSYSLNRVDFLYEINNLSYTSGAGWSNWPKESGVKIYFILQDLEEGDTNTNLNTGVVINYTRSTGYSNRVTATYTVLGDASYAPANTTGAQSAKITDGR